MTVAVLALILAVCASFVTGAYAQPAGRIEIDEVLGGWQAEQDREITIGIERDGEQLRVVGEHTWEPIPARPGRPDIRNQPLGEDAPAPGLTLTFRRLPKAAEMDQAVPEWARRAVETRLEWTLEFTFRRENGAVKASTRFDPGEIRWEERREGRVVERKAE